MEAACNIHLRLGYELICGSTLSVATMVASKPKGSQAFCKSTSTLQPSRPGLPPNVCRKLDIISCSLGSTCCKLRSFHICW